MEEASCGAFLPSRWVRPYRVIPVHLYPVLQPIVKFLLTLFWRPTVSGLQHVPSSGRMIMACNHTSAFETYFVPCTIPREIHWLGKDALFKGKGVPGKFFAWLMRSVNVIPVDRSGNGGASSALDAGIAVLEGEHALGVFPEGTRSHDGRMYRGKTGAVRLALATGAPILPVAELGAFEAQRSKNSIVPKLRSKLHTQIGPTIDMRAQLATLRADNPSDAPATREELRTLTRSLMEAIRELSGQEYVDEYAADVKKRLKDANVS